MIYFYLLRDGEEEIRELRFGKFGEEMSAQIIYEKLQPFKMLLKEGAEEQGFIYRTWNGHLIC